MTIDFANFRLPPPRKPTFNWQPLDLRPRSPWWYLSYPTRVISLCGGHNGQLVPMWYCVAGPNRLVEVRGARTYVIDMCGAPPGVRCSRCRSQEQGHDPGDEDDGGQP